MNNITLVLIERLTGHLRVPLYRNGYLLMFSAIATSGLGVLYWMLAARYYSAEVVGRNSALLSTLTLLSGIAQLSLGGVLVRFVPVAGRLTPRLVRWTYVVSTFVAAAIGLLFGLVLSHWSPTLRFLSEQPLFLAVFVCSNVAWCIFTLQDSVLTGLRQTTWIVIENSAFALIKIVLLLFFATSFQEFGLFASWAVPIVLSLVPINVLIARRFIPKHIMAASKSTVSVTVSQVARYVSGNYPGWLFFLASTTLLPLIVADQLGVRANAYFYLPWTIASSLYLIAVNMMTSLTVEASANQAQLSLYCYRTLVHVLRLVIPVVVIVFLGAPYILQVFGSEYVDKGTWLMRLLALAAIPNVIVVLYITYARVRNQIIAIILVQGALCALGLGLSLALLRLVGIIGVGFAWLVAQTSVAIVVLLTQLRPVLQEGFMAEKRGQKSE